MSEIVEKVRTMFKEGDDVRDAGLTTPHDIVRFDDIAYGTDPSWQSLDVYRPRAAETSDAHQTLPVIVSVHGGGWVYGDKERYQYYCMSLAQHGFAVINFTYRLAPEFSFPASMEDTNAVFGWVMNNAATYGLDTDHVFAVGDSAGANMLAMYANVLTNPAYAARYDFAAPAGLALTAIALNCGAFDIDLSQELTGALMPELFGHPLSEDDRLMVSPAHYVTPSFPPSFVMTAVDDFLKDQAPLMVDTLMANDVPFELHFYGDKTNRLAHVFHCNMRSDDALRCNKEECDYFKKFL